MSGAMAPEAETIIRQTETINRLMGQSSTQIERVQRSLDAAYAAQSRFSQAQNTINTAMERGRISQERANQLLQLAQQRYQQAGQAATQFAGANDNAARASGRFSQQIGQVGFQVQDFAVQVASGQSALTAFAQQAPQALGAFGNIGIFAGVAIAVGAIAVQLLRGGDANKLFNDTLEKSKELYDALNDAAERRTEGQDREINRVLRLRDYYASLTEAQREGVRALEEAANRRLQLESGRLLDTATTRIRPLLSIGQNDDFGLARTPDALREVETALQAIDLQSGRSEQQLLAYLGALQRVTQSSTQYAPAARTALEAASALREQFARLDEAARAAGRGIDEAAVAQRALQRQIAAGNVGQELTAQLFQQQQIASRLARGDVSGARAITRQQEIDDRARSLAEQATDAARRSFPEGTDRTTVDAAIRARRDQIEQDALRLARLERENRDAEAAARERERAASRGGGGGGRRAAPANTADAILARRDAFLAANDPAERYAQTLANIGRLNAELEAAGRDPLPDAAVIRATDEALRQYQQATETAADSTDNLAQSSKDLQFAARGLGQSLGGAFEDLVFNGEKAGDVIRSLERDLLRLGTRLLITQPLEQAFSSLFSGGGGGSGGGAGGGIGALVTSGAQYLSSLFFHEGGLVGAGGRAGPMLPAAIFADAPRYHSGGFAGRMPFANDEVPAVLRRGELVMTQRQQDAVRREMGRSINQTVIVQTEDPGSFNRTKSQMARDMRRELARASRSA
jgi:hypothetical protein